MSFGRNWLFALVAACVAWVAAADPEETTLTVRADVPEALTAEGVTWGETPIGAEEVTCTAPEYATLASFAGIRYACAGYVLSNATAEVSSGAGRSVTFTPTPSAGPYTLLWKWDSREIVADKTYYANAVTGDDDNSGEDAAHPFKTVHAAHVAATNYLAQNSGQTALISLAEGSYPLTNNVTFVAGERMAGAGRDRTGLNLRNCDCGMTSSDCAVKLVSADNLLSSLCVTGRPSAGKSHAVSVYHGRVEHFRSAYHFAGINDSCGLALYMEGGEAQFCLLDANIVDGMYPQGIGICCKGSALVSDSEICNNKDHAGRSGKGQGVYLEGSAVMRRCRIHDNNTQKYQWLSGSAGGGVYLAGGVLENSLVYNNWFKGAETGGGVYNNGGTVRYCTIYGNTCSGDTTGASGCFQNKGTAINNIIFGNYKPGAVVKNGTFVTNLLDAAVAGRAVNFVADDSGMADPAHGDFTIPKRSSLAVENAQPLAAVTTDYAGLKRAEKPTIGAYEYDASHEEFEVALQIAKVTCLYGTAASAKAVITGVAGTTPTVAWFIDGVEEPSFAGQVEISTTALDYGWHSVRVEVTKGGEMKSDEKAEGLCILGDRVYVNTTGSGTFPYATAATGTNDINVALDALWQTDGHVSYVDVDAGTYLMTAQALLKYPVVIAGRGDGSTVLRPKAPLSTRGFLLRNSQAVVSDMTVSNFTGHGAATIESGLMTRCRFICCTCTEYGGTGGAVAVSGGSLRDSTVEKCGCHSELNVSGGGVYISDGLVSNCTICACTCHCGTRTPNGQRGGGMAAFGGTVWNTAILDCVDTATEYSAGAGLYVDRSSSTHANTVLRNCLVANCSSVYSSPVLIRYGIFDNCTFTANRAPDGISGVELSAVSDAPTCVPALRNCVIWGNGADPSIVTNASLSYCCYPQGTNGTNTAQDPKLRSARKLYAISSFGSCFRAGTVLGWMTEGATDLMGRPRTTLVGEEPKVDIGCHQVGNDPGLMLLVR